MLDQWLKRLSRGAIAYLDACIEKSRIDCQWRRRGRYHGTASSKGKRLFLDPLAQELDALGEAYRRLDRAQFERETGCPYYHAAIHMPGGALMNPVALTRGLADTMPSGVTLYENSPVVEAQLADTVRLVTPNGSVSALRG